MDGTNTKLTLDGRDERRSLEERTRQSLQRPRESSRVWECRVETKNTNILLTCKQNKVSIRVTEDTNGTHQRPVET